MSTYYLCKNRRYNLEWIGKIDNERIVIFECSDEYDIRIGDELLGNIGPLGKTLLLNVTNKESIEAIVKEIK